MEKYKALAKFEDEVNEVVYDAYYKGFEECKRKVAHAFHLPDLKDIVIDEPEKTGEKGVIIVEGVVVGAIEAAEFEVNPGPP